MKGAEVAKLIPGILGALLVSLGVGALLWQAGLIVAGGFLLALDRRI